MLSIKLLFIIDESEQENIIILWLEVHNAFNILGVVIQLNSNIHVLSSFTLHNHEHVFVVFLDSMSQLPAAESILIVLNHTLNVGLTWDLILVLLI